MPVPTITIADTCHDCATPVTPRTCVMFGRTPDDTITLCHDCGRKHDLEQAAETGELFAYVTSHTDKYRYNTTSPHWNRVAQKAIDAVTTCVGTPLNAGNVHTLNTWRSNFGDTRTVFRCLLPTGPNNTLQWWSGIAYAGDGGYARLRRSKVQA